MKTKLVTLNLGLGRTAWVERTAYGCILAKADLHHDDPIWTLTFGTPKECWKAICSVARSIRNNRCGKIILGKHAPLDYPERHVLSRTFARAAIAQTEGRGM